MNRPKRSLQVKKQSVICNRLISQYSIHNANSVALRLF